MQVSFVVPLFNCLSLTQAMVASLHATLAPGLAHEIILVDDGSTDGTRAWLATLRAPFRVVLNERNLGYAAANNRGAAIARGEWLALLNNDLVLLPHWLNPLLALCRRLGTRAGCVGNVQRAIRTGAVDHAGIVINHQGKPQHERSLPWWSWLAGRTSREVTAVTGACMLVRRSAWEELGGFDDRYRNGCEDVDLCLRAKAAGYINAVAYGSVVQHHVSSSMGRKDRNEENTFKFTQRWRESLIPLGCRQWSWHVLERLAASDPARIDYATASEAFLYAFRFAGSPAPRLLLGMSESIEVELTRWREMIEK